MKRAVPLLHAQVAEGNGTRIAACGAMTSSYYILGSHWTVVTVVRVVHFQRKKSSHPHQKTVERHFFHHLWDSSMAQYGSMVHHDFLPSFPSPAAGILWCHWFLQYNRQFFGHSPRRPPTQGRPPPNFCRRFLCSCGKPITKTTSRRFLHTKTPAILDRSS